MSGHVLLLLLLLIAMLAVYTSRGRRRLASMPAACAALRDAVINFRHPRRHVPFMPR